MARTAVIVPCYNSERYLRPAVESALAQEQQDCEILCVDNGSSDSTLAILESYGGRVRVIHETRRGAPCARNAGIRQADSEFVAFLDSDDYWEPEKLARQLEVMRSRPEVGLVATDFWVRTAGSRGERTLVRCPRSDHLRALFWGCCLHTSTLLMRREVLDEVGLLDESLPMSDDYDLLLRIAARYPIATVPAPLSTYRLHEGSLSLRSFEQTIACTDRVITSFCQRHPGFRRLAPRRRAQERVRVARLLLTRNRVLAARLNWEALRLDPGQWQAGLGLGLCALPAPYGPLRKCSRLLSGLRAEACR